MIAVDKALSKEDGSTIRTFPVRKKDEERKVSYWEYRYYCPKCRRLYAYNASSGCYQELDPIIYDERYSKKRNAVILSRQ
jgi:hypothetical protein